MTVLAAQSIRRACIPDANGRLWAGKIQIAEPILSPFAERGIANGRSFGLSACTYDLRIADGLLLPVGASRLAVTLERFALPDNVCGSVLDKSTYARAFVTAFNTHLDPGWCGYLTVELANLGTEAYEWAPGDALCQVKFELLDEPTELPYRGKYQDQPKVPILARREV